MSSDYDGQDQAYQNLLDENDALLAGLDTARLENEQLRKENADNLRAIKGLKEIWNHLASPYDCESHELVEILEKYGFMERGEE